MGVLALAACGEGIEADSDAAGYEYGADQAAISEAIADLDDVTITYQTLAPSGQDPLGAQANVFKEILEERSEGKIELDIVWGMAAAGFDEVRDAVVDGRIDIGYTNPIYYPAEFPVMNAYATATALLETTPFEGELVAQAVGRELAVTDEAISEEYERQELVPLVHAMNHGYVNMCNQPVRNEDEWSGKQIRIASVTQSEIASALGAAGVSTDITEAYEALQRGTVTCIMTQPSDSLSFGYADAATDIGYTTETSIPRSPAVFFAGPSFDRLPLPYRQLIFDSINESMADWHRAGIGGWSDSFSRVADSGGVIEQIDEPSQQVMAEVTDELIDGLIAEGDLPETVRDDVSGFTEKWKTRAAELGYEDGGDVAEVADWYDSEADLTPWFEELIADESLNVLRPE
ncbi:hypothetical protein [Brevibacterium album]|uniref:hypothetical protein n=1 Tax=Brevibacterium album TaxID=417948 RepID=UPI000416854A|nr:hypothetical protein [Brevibacterium album]